jgi:redox-sensitive bicupin YhaK (pirin superfamily)
MKTVLHRANTRGFANHGWLKSYHSFSFANYYNPERMNFGMLRVLNDDEVAGGRGFGTHPHNNMEIISIPLEGDLKHMDNMGNATVIRQGEVQVMSAGTGVSHSEYNKNLTEDVKFLQIWVIPRERNVTPRYDQISVEDISKKNEFFQIVSPNPEENGVWIHQDAWFHMGIFNKNSSVEYPLNKKGNGVYIFILEGKASINANELLRRDALGIWDTDSIAIEVSANSEILLIEVPMV